MNDFGDIFGALDKKRSQYSMDEIKKAEQQAQKTGKSFLDVLQDSTGKILSGNTFDMDPDLLAEIKKMSQKLGQSAENDDTGKTDTRDRTADPDEKCDADGKSDANRKDDSNQIDIYNRKNERDICAEALRDIDRLNQQLEKDFGIKKDNVPETEEKEETVSASSFDGIQKILEEKVFGQKDFLRKLIIAFKRPFVLPEEEGHAKNTLFVNGPEDSGKHMALMCLAQELKGRRILNSSEIAVMDLSVYGVAGKDNVFLQDLYTALSSNAQILLFENYEDCHISYLTYISELVMKGACRLPDRYMFQKGQLINVSNSFAAEAVSTFSAKGKYIVFLGTKGVDSLADVLGAPFVNTLGDICTSEMLTEESFKKIAKVEFDKLAETAGKQLGFVIIRENETEEQILSAAVAATANKVGTAGILTFFSKLLKSLANLKLEGSYPKDTEVSILIEDGKLMAKIGEEKTDLMASLPTAYAGEIDKVKAELDAIVGLHEVKEYILSLEEYYNTQKRRKEAGLKASEVSKHMIFTGNPGTGKTTIARIVSRYLKAIGVLSGGQLVEVSRADLVGRYVGHTAPLVNQVIKSAIGGVLFIDEAYSLYRGKDDNFGLEAIDTLVKGIEDNRDDLIVILAGYDQEMEEFLEANSGLKSRFPNFIHFPDYTAEELLEITKITVKSKGYVLDENAQAALLDYYGVMQSTCPDTAGNGRLVRNKVEEAILNQSKRLVAEPDADLSLLMEKDFELTIE